MDVISSNFISEALSGKLELVRLFKNIRAIFHNSLTLVSQPTNHGAV